jgi:hypothetical protein
VRAVRAGQTAAMRVLIEAGADIEARSQVTSRECDTHLGACAYVYARVCEFVRVTVTPMFMQLGASVLCYAGAWNNITAMRILIKAGVKIDAKLKV